MHNAAIKNHAQLPAVPLITCDPYFNIWSPSDRLYDSDSTHWAGDRKRITGTAIIDGEERRFMGCGRLPAMEQIGCTVTATASEYIFEACGIRLFICFRTPLLLTDLDLTAQPCSYIDTAAQSLDGNAHQLTIRFTFDREFCYDGDVHPEMGGGDVYTEQVRYAWMGQKKQAPLCHSGDGITIDWGYLFLAVPGSSGSTVTFEPEGAGLTGVLPMEIPQTGTGTAYLVTAYDDIVSIFYFGKMLPGYWARDGKTIYTVIAEAIARHDELVKQCSDFDNTIKDMTAAFGEDYGILCEAAYRQSIAAHKLIADENGQPVFLSKENFSNGCMGTVDVTYPSTPLYFLFNPELVRGMLRPVLTFARMPVWEYDFAPHDVGRYPYAGGQVYGLRPYPKAAVTMNGGEKNGHVHPPYYQMPSGQDIYLLKYQMPVEESGNMLILLAALSIFDPEGDKGFTHRHMDLCEKWVKYLLEYGADPGEQLCTDDFAGHLAHNINLSIKAVMGVAAYSILLQYLNQTAEAETYMAKAREMAQSVTDRADAGDHTKLTFDGPENGWSLKYNLVWDILFKTDLFPTSLCAQEIAWYKTKTNRYGVPLDSRANYTKSDWIMWSAAMSVSDAEVCSFSASVRTFLAETKNRVPFSDWYNTLDAGQVGFQNRSVQGGIFMPLFKKMADGKRQLGGSIPCI